MALDVSKLVPELRKIFDPSFEGFYWSESRSDTVTRISAAHDLYASDAVDYSGDAVATKNPGAFRSTLDSELWDTWTAAEAADAFRDAWIAYWTGGTFAVGALPPPTGVCANVGGDSIFSVEFTSVITIINAAPLRAALYAEFRNLGTNGYTKAVAIANAFHAATTNNLTVRIDGLDTTPPPVGPLPIYNVCGVH